MNPDVVGAIATLRAREILSSEQAAFFEGSDGPKMRQEGWTSLLDNLAKALAST